MCISNHIYVRAQLSNARERSAKASIRCLLYIFNRHVYYEWHSIGRYNYAYILCTSAHTYVCEIYFYLKKLYSKSLFSFSLIQSADLDGRKILTTEI